MTSVFCLLVMMDFLGKGSSLEDYSDLADQLFLKDDLISHGSSGKVSRDKKNRVF